MTKDNLDTFLHIGCGLKTPEEWMNIDASPSLRLSKIPIIGRPILSFLNGPNWPKLVRCGDIVKGLNIKPNSCQLVFASHVLEHLSLSDFHRALDHIHLYLKPGGTFRAIVPDLKKYIDSYITHYSDGVLAANASHEFMKTSLLGYEGSRSNLYRRFREIFSNARHQWLWDEPSLIDALIQHGFKNIRRCQYGDWSSPQFQFVETENNHLYAICVEAMK